MPDYGTRTPQESSSLNAAQHVRTTLGFLQSVILSGEAFTETVAAQYSEAVVALDALEAVVREAHTVSEIERTGVLPDFQPLADALAALGAWG